MGQQVELFLMVHDGLKLIPRFYYNSQQDRLNLMFNSMFLQREELDRSFRNASMLMAAIFRYETFDLVRGARFSCS